MDSLAPPSFVERAVSFGRSFAADDAGNAYAEYALVATIFAVVMIAMMTLVQDAAAGQLAFTDTGLDNRNGVTP